MADLRESLEAIKDVAKLFAPLATVSEAVDSLLAVVSHEAELRQSIEEKIAEKARLENEMQARVAEADAEIEHRKTVQRNAEEGYQARLDALDRELKQAKAGRDARLIDVRGEVERATSAAAATIRETESTCQAERQRIVAEHAAFIEETKAHRARIEANTKTLEERLAGLREQAKAALGAVEG